MGYRKKQVEVELRRGFGIGKHQVTRRIWKESMGTEPWNENASVEGHEDSPATNISWQDASDFCAKLTESERQQDRLPATWQYTLPTESQWEYACRAGTASKFFFDDSHLLDRYAWFDANSKATGEERPHRVGLKTSNPWGLHDVLGNVWEWCLDTYQERLPGGTDPVVLNETSYRVVRGGSCFDPAAYCQVAARSWCLPVTRRSGVGFRIAIVNTDP